VKSTPLIKLPDSIEPLFDRGPPYGATGRQRQPLRSSGSMAPRATKNQRHNLLPAPTNDRLSHEMDRCTGPVTRSWS
jgi:hypothetical protein